MSAPPAKRPKLSSGSTEQQQALAWSEAAAIVDKALKVGREMQALTAKEGKTSKKVKEVARTELINVVRSNDASAVLTHIKTNKKELVSATFSATLMSCIRKQLSSRAHGASRKARIVGLVSKPQLNGSVCTLMEVDQETGRQVVLLPDSSKIKLKSVNLEACSP